jgi:hypothetical protein
VIRIGSAVLDKLVKWYRLVDIRTGGFFVTFGSVRGVYKKHG